MIRQIWILIAKRLSGEASEEELEELDRYAGSAGEDSQLELLEQLWNENPEPGVTPDHIDRRWGNLHTRLHQADQPAKSPTPVLEQIMYPARQNHTRLWMGLAAAVLLIGSFVYLYSSTDKNEQSITAISPPQSGVSKIILPDGSSVWLNSGSKITYKNNPETKCREVVLSGEAYFDVVKDARHPFTVTTSAFKIKVLGTAFNVRSYERSNSSEAMLVRGRIELSLTKDPGKKYILKPADKLTFSTHPPMPEKVRSPDLAANDTRNPSIEFNKTNEYEVDGLPSEVLWMKDVIDFDDAQFKDIAQMMEHKYHVVITFKNEKIGSQRFTGKFKNETLDQALKDMQELIDFHYTILKDQVSIY